MNEQVLYDYALCCLVPIITVPVVRRMIGEFGDKEALLCEVSAEDLRIAGFRLNEEQAARLEAVRDLAKLKEKREKEEEAGIRFVSETEETYPERLLDLEDRPFGLFYLGKLPESERKAVAIVGSRRSSLYGRDMAAFFGKALAEAGVNMISGMAFGIDGYAGRGALAVPSSSFAVLGGGVDRCYPMENLDLYEALKKQGGILSERPPGYSLRNYDFPLRNRLISGLSDVTVVIEAAENSGSLITANYANEQNKSVFALPGRVTDRMAAGTNRLLKEGAEVLTCPEDLFQYLGLQVKKDTRPPKNIRLDRTEAAVFDCFGNEPRSVDELVRLSGLPASTLMETLVGLEIKGAVKKTEGGAYERLLRGKN